MRLKTASPAEDPGDTRRRRYYFIYHLTWSAVAAADPRSRYRGNSAVGHDGVKQSVRYVRT